MMQERLNKKITAKKTAGQLVHNSKRSMGSRYHAMKYLQSVELKHNVYFQENHLNIMDCIRISGNDNIHVELTNQSLPLEIRKDINLMFWL